MGAVAETFATEAVGSGKAPAVRVVGGVTWEVGGAAVEVVGIEAGKVEGDDEGDD